MKKDKATSDTLKADTTGKWRRIARQHQEEMETSNLENKENWAPNGSKRGLQEEEKAYVRNREIRIEEKNEKES